LLRIKRGQVTIVRPLLIGERGQVKIDMVLDTGASLTMIPPYIARGLGYNPARSRKRVQLITASRIETAPVITLEAIELLGQRIEEVDVVCKNLPPQSRAEGLLGVNFLDNFDIDLYYKQGKLKLKDP